MDNKKKLGKKIQELRKSKGLTQEKLAELINMEQNTISVIESGRSFPTLATLEKISCALGVNLSDFFNYDYFESVEELKLFIENKLKDMNDAQIKQVFRFVKNVI